MQLAMTDMREIRRHLGLTQIEMAERLGVQQSTISRYERGDLTVDKRTMLALDALLAAGSQAGEAAKAATA